MVAAKIYPPVAELAAVPSAAELAVARAEAKHELYLDAVALWGRAGTLLSEAESAKGSAEREYLSANALSALHRSDDALADAAARAALRLDQAKAHLAHAREAAKRAEADLTERDQLDIEAQREATRAKAAAEIESGSYQSQMAAHGSAIVDLVRVGLEHVLAIRALEADDARVAAEAGVLPTDGVAAAGGFCHALHELGGTVTRSGLHDYRWPFQPPDRAYIDHDGIVMLTTLFSLAMESLAQAKRNNERKKAPEMGRPELAAAGEVWSRHRTYAAARAEQDAVAVAAVEGQQRELAEAVAAGSRAREARDRFHGFSLRANGSPNRGMRGLWWRGGPRGHRASEPHRVSPSRVRAAAVDHLGPLVRERAGRGVHPRGARAD